MHMQTSTQFTIGFIGGGNMAQALIIGLKNQGFNLSNILVIDPDAEKRRALAASFHVQTSETLNDVSAQDAIVLAVKPQQLKSVAQDLAATLKQQLIISIAAGIRIATLQAWLGGYPHIIRTMPNTPAQIQAGVTGLYASTGVSDAHKAMADILLSAAGETLWLTAEEKLDAVTAISGSGPAYVFYFIEALTAAALDLGLTQTEADLLAKQTFKGASLLADNSNTAVSTLREQVTSKGGTTEQGLLSLAESQVKEAMVKATQAAAKRAKILGDELGK